ncbi:MAG: hypothetical protein H0U86_17215 [Chloroflexi bacterium]|nr:hypothetical protein [Chloroflexota bacterium]
MASAGVGRAQAGRLVAALVGLTAGLLTLALPPSEGPPVTTYTEASATAATLFVVAGLGMTLAGVVASLTQPGRRLIGDLALLAGFLWFSPAWVGWDLGPSVVRNLAMVAAAFTLPVVAHLVLASSSGRAHPRAAAVLVGGLYVEAALAALGLSLFRDPFFDPGCWANCTDNVFLVRSLPAAARWIEVADRWFVAAAAAALVAICAWRLAKDSGPARRVAMPVVGPGMLFAGAVVAHAVAAQRASVESPSDPAFMTIFLVGSAAVLLLAAGVIWGALRTLVHRRSVARVVASLGEAPAPGSLESALARAVGDPGLRIAYWLPESDQYVDAKGRPVPAPVAGSGWALTTLVRDGRRIAVVSHAAALAELEREIGSAIRLGLENERLQAEVLARLEELRASRARIVETGDAERIRLERDLHDGAQQRLLALSYDIRLARASAEEDGDGRTARLLTGAVDGVQAAVDELRELAHGIYPAILGEAGLAPALETLADAATLPVEVRCATARRLPAPVETAAYLVVSETVDDAAHRGAGYAAVSVTEEDGRLVVTVEDDGSRRTSSMVRVADRIGSVGGSVIVEPTMIRAEIPCE